MGEVADDMRRASAMGMELNEYYAYLAETTKQGDGEEAVDPEAPHKYVAPEIKGLVNPEALKKSMDVNSDGYGGAANQVGINVMKYLDTFEGEFNIGYYPDLTTTHGIICHCDDQGGITGFMAGAARNLVAVCYKDGWKFWLADVINKFDVQDDGSIRNLDNRIETLLGSDVDLGVTEPEIREYAQGLARRWLEKKYAE